MKPTAFEYHAPTTIDETVALLSEHDAELMAGNQSLGVAMSARLATPDHVIDLNGVSDLSYIHEEGEIAFIGSMTRHREIADSDLLRRSVPVLPEAAGLIAGPAVRNRGTLGGSLAEADPAGNYPTVLTALDADLDLVSARGERTVPVRDFFVGHMMTVLRGDELIAGASIPTGPFPRDRTGMAFRELKRVPQTWPKLSAAAVVRLADPTVERPVIEEARLAFANAADVPLRVEACEQTVAGRPLEEECLADAADAAMDAADPVGEVHADAEYKEDQVGVYTRRALRAAYERACNGR